MKYQRKPEIVEATQWFKMGDHPLPITPWTEFCEICRHCGKQMKKHCWIREGNLTVCPGDWIIIASNGEISVVKDSVFREMYEAVKKADGMKPEILGWMIRYDIMFGDWEVKPWVKIVDKSIKINTIRYFQEDKMQPYVFVDETDPITAFAKGAKLIMEEVKKDA